MLIDGGLVVETEDALVLRERGLAPRYYLPAGDVREEMLRPSAKRTFCRHKGAASYRSVVTSRGEHRDVAWLYERPKPKLEAIAGRLCFYDERVNLELG